MSPPQPFALSCFEKCLVSSDARFWMRVAISRNKYEISYASTPSNIPHKNPSIHLESEPISVRNSIRMGTYLSYTQRKFNEYMCANSLTHQFKTVTHGLIIGKSLGPFLVSYLNTNFNSTKRWYEGNCCGKRKKRKRERPFSGCSRLILASTP